MVALERAAAEISEKTQKRVTVKYFPGGQQVVVAEAAQGDAEVGQPTDEVVLGVVCSLASVDAAVTGDERALGEAGHEMGFFTEVLFPDDEAKVFIDGAETRAKRFLDLL